MRHDEQTAVFFRPVVKLLEIVEIEYVVPVLEKQLWRDAVHQYLRIRRRVFVIRAEIGRRFQSEKDVDAVFCAFVLELIIIVHVIRHDA